MTKLIFLLNKKIKQLFHNNYVIVVDIFCFSKYNKTHVLCTM